MRSTTLDQDSAEANALLDLGGTLFDGRDAAIVFPVLLALFRHGSEQATADIRSVNAQHLRDLANELEALDAPKH
jgi:hypothetical protein